MPLSSPPVVKTTILAASLILIADASAYAASFDIPGGATLSTAQTLGAGTTGTIESGGALSVSDSSVAVTVTGSTTITNDGTIEQTGTGRGIRDNSGKLTLVIDNNAGATIYTNDNDAIQMNKGSSNVTLNNHGTIISNNASAGGAQAIDFNAIDSGTNVINNFEGATIQANEADAVRPGVNGVVNNSGTIRATNNPGSDSSSDGVDAQENSGVTIVNAANGTDIEAGTGLIEGARHGITGGNTDPTVDDGAYTLSITNNLGGTIQGDDGSGVNIDGLNANEVVTIVNHGTITGNGLTGDGDGVDVDGLVNITNSGTILSTQADDDTSEGITVGGGTIVNSGLIEGDNLNGGSSRGITLAGVDKDADGDPIPPQGIYGDTSVTNSGTIRGQTGAAIAMTGGANAFTLAIQNLKGGLLEGGGSEAVIQTGANQTSISNAGTIRNQSMSSSAIAIASSGTAPVSIVNSGLVLGTVNLAGTGNRFDNQADGVWNLAGGTSTLGGDAAYNALDNEIGATIVTALAGIASTTRLDNIGTFTNAGLLTMQNGVAGDRTVIGGDFVGQGGVLALDTSAAGYGSASDMLVITGNASGDTTLAINNAGSGAGIGGNGMEIVQVQGQSSGDAFKLASAVSIGAYDYNLYLGGLGADAGNQNWYLRSMTAGGKPLLSPMAQSALPYPSILLNFADATLGTYSQRSGNRIPSASASQIAADLPSAQAMAYAPKVYGQGAWGRIVGQYGSYDPKSGASYNQSLGFLQAGYEGTAFESAGGDLKLGFYGVVGTSRADIDLTPDPVTGAERGKAHITTTGYGIGATATWLGQNGLYADLVGQVTGYSSDLSNKGHGDNSGWSTAVSLEAGQRLMLGGGWAVVPQAQLSWSHVDFSSFTDALGNAVSLGRGDSLRGRAGIRIENETNWQSAIGQDQKLNFYGVANLDYEFLDGTKVNVSGTSLEQQDRRLWGEAGLGATYSWDKQWSVYAEADYAHAFASGDNYSVKGSAGVKYRW